MNNGPKKIMLAILIYMSLTSGCVVQNSSSDKYVGDWNFYSSTGTTGTIRIAKVDSGHSAILVTSYGEKPINNFILAAKHISGNFEVMGSDVQMEGDIKGNHLSGTLVSGSQTHTIKADKVRSPIN